MYLCGSGGGYMYVCVRVCGWLSVCGWIHSKKNANSSTQPLHVSSDPRRCGKLPIKKWLPCYTTEDLLTSLLLSTWQSCVWCVVQCWKFVWTPNQGITCHYHFLQVAVAASLIWCQTKPISMLACQHSYARIHKNGETGIYIYSTHKRWFSPERYEHVHLCKNAHTRAHNRGKGRGRGRGRRNCG